VDVVRIVAGSCTFCRGKPLHRSGHGRLAAGSHGRHGRQQIVRQTAGGHEEQGRQDSHRESAANAPDKSSGKGGEKTTDNAAGKGNTEKSADKGGADADKRKSLTPAEAAAQAAAQVAAQADHGPPDAAIWVKGRLNDNPDRIELSLGDYVILGLNESLQSYLKKDEKVTNKLGLYINDLFFKDIPPLGVPGRVNAVMFHLKRTDDNRDSWSVLFSRKSFTVGHRQEACAHDGNDGITLTAGYPDGTKVADITSACIEYFPDKLAAMGLLLLAAAIGVATVWLARNSSMIRDIGIPPANKLGTYSLARFQMALWFVTIVFGLLWAYASPAISRRFLMAP